MIDLTRRGFLRSASIGAAAAGVLGALPSLAHAQEQGPGPAMPLPASGSIVPMPIPPAGAATPSTPMVVYIDNPASGRGIIFIGEQAITFDSPALVQSLKSAMA